MNADDPRFSAYLFDELDPVSRAEIDAALAEDPRLLAELQGLDAIAGGLRRELQAGAPIDLEPIQRAAIFEALPSDAEAPAGRIVEMPAPWWRSASLLSGAAACIVVGVSAWSLGRYQAPRQEVVKNRTAGTFRIALQEPGAQGFTPPDPRLDAPAHAVRAQPGVVPSEVAPGVNPDSLRLPPSQPSASSLNPALAHSVPRQPRSFDPVTDRPEIPMVGSMPSRKHAARTAPDQRPAVAVPRRTKTTVGRTEIAALEGSFSAASREAVFKGSVTVKEPDLEIACDRIVAELGFVNGSTAEESEVRKVTADANSRDVVRVVVRGRTPDGSFRENIGTAKRAVYDADTGDVTLTGNPSVTQGRNNVRGTSPSTVLTLRRDGTVSAVGSTVTVVPDPPKKNR